MKRSLLITAFFVGAYYLIKELLSSNAAVVAEPRKKHVTKAFSKAKEHALRTAE